MNIWTQHLDEVNETYFQHMRNALSFSGHMMVGAAACAVHAIAPFLFETAGSRRIRELHERMVVARNSKSLHEGATFSAPASTLKSAAESGSE